MAVVQADLHTVEDRLRAAAPSPLPVVNEVLLHMVGAGGKRVRPALALLCGRATGAISEATFDVAVGVELVHIASLLHDDVIDDGDRRRSRLTAHRLWGNKHAVLVADHAHAAAYELISQRCSRVVIRRLSRTVARMVRGELSQMANEGCLDVTEEVYYQMVEDKTGCLMGCAGELGALVSGAAPDEVQACFDFGLSIGTAFQVVDDLLDLTGDEGAIGKPVGSDLRCRRMTLPLIHALRSGTESRRHKLAELLGREEIGRAEMETVRGVVEEAGGLDYARQQADRLAGEARVALRRLPESEAGALLDELAGYVVTRSH